MKNSPEDFNSTFKQTEESISEFKDKSIEMTKSQDQKKKMKIKTV
jgi:hypothetical protein